MCRGNEPKGISTFWARRERNKRYKDLVIYYIAPGGKDILQEIQTRLLHV